MADDRSREGERPVGEELRDLALCDACGEPMKPLGHKYLAADSCGTCNGGPQYDRALTLASWPRSAVQRTEKTPQI
jgi:hypothetical protein